MLRRSTVAILAALIALPVVTMASATLAHATTPGSNGKIAFTSNLDGRTEVYTVNTDGTGATEITDGDGADSPSWSPDGSMLAFAGGPAPAGIYTVGATGGVPHRVTDGSFMTAWSGDGSKLAFVGGTSGAGPDIFTVNLDGTNRQDVLPGSVSPAWSPDGTKIAYRGFDGLYIANADGSNQTRLTTTAGDGNPSFSPDGTKIAFDSGGGGSHQQVWIVNADGSNPVQVTSSSTVQASNPSWSPDGSSLVVRTYEGTNYALAILNTDGSSLHTIVSNMGTVDGPDWQPIPKPKPPLNGKIVFSTPRAGNGDWEVYSVNPDGTALTNLTNNPAIDWWPAVSPDGSEIAFSSNRNSPPGIYVMKSDGTDVHLVAAPGGFFGLSWSGDGSKIAYVAPSPGDNSSPDIWIVGADGSNPTDVVSGGQNRFPTFSPDGTKIIWDKTGAGAGLFIANADGSNPVQLTDDSTGIDQKASFAPDGKSIIFNRTANPPNSNASSQLWTMNVDGSGQKQLTNFAGFNAWPRYSPDGHQIVFQQSSVGSDGPFNLAIMNADGSGVRTLESVGDNEFPDWQPVMQPVVPGAPAQVTATGGNAWAKVSWTPPVYDGGASVSSYTVTGSPGGATVTVPGSQTSATVPGLTNGTPYTFTVEATNSTGVGPASAPSVSITPVAKFNGRIAFTRTVAGEDQVFTSAEDGTDVRQITNYPGGAGFSTWSPDGTQLAIDGGPDPQGVYIIDADGTNPRPVSDTPELEVSWSPDGSKLAYIHLETVSNTVHIVTVNIDGTGESDLGTGLAPEWTPDSQRIVFFDNHQLWIMNADGTGRMPYGETVTGTSASVSPDGSKIAFAGIGGIYAIGIDGGNPTLLYSSDTTDWPRWSPDGKQIVFQTARASTTGSTLAVMNVDGSNEHPITSGQGNDQFPDWQALAQPGIPSAPTNVAATAADSSAVVHWTAPTSPGSGPVTNYTVTSSPGGKTATVAAPATQATVSGLTNGTPYTFTVHATNAYGDSIESAASHSVKPRPDSRGGFVLDDWGGIHPFHTGVFGPPAITVPGPYWPGQDVVRGIASVASAGFVVDDWGGIHPYVSGTGVTVPPVHGGPYWPGQDVVRGIALMPGGTGGYVLDDWGGLHPFAVGVGAAPPQPRGGPYWAGIDAARGVTILPDGSGGYVVDSWGGLHPFVIPGPGHSMPAQPTNGPYWAGQNVVRGVAADAEGNGGYVVDDWGGIHPFSIPGTAGPVPAPSAGPYWPGLDAVRGISVVP